MLREKKKEYKKINLFFLAASFLVIGYGVAKFLGSYKQEEKLNENSLLISASMSMPETKTDHMEEARMSEKFPKYASNYAGDFLYQGESVDDLNIRISAGLDKDVVFVVPKGTLLNIIDYANQDWVRIRALDGRTGWCNKNYLKVRKSSVSEPTNLTEEEVVFSAFNQVTFEKATIPFTIHVFIKEQRVVVADAQDLVVQSFTCSTGKEGYETPTGMYYINHRGKSFYNEKLKEGAFYWTQFYGDYLFHSVPFNEDREIEKTEADKLGEPASHGCIRLSMNDAKWIYDNIKKDTKVIIQ
ncbi:MAG: L,D-transpeptidase catalytic domain protein [Ruminococcaceae bacterium]|nr:L,D-transpeptidase catalytic domain protein [Oscillospiraceae bacterium]